MLNISKNVNKEKGTKIVKEKLYKQPDLNNKKRLFNNSPTSGKENK